MSSRICLCDVHVYAVYYWFLLSYNQVVYEAMLCVHIYMAEEYTVIRVTEGVLEVLRCAYMYMFLLNSISHMTGRSHDSPTNLWPFQPPNCFFHWNLCLHLLWKWSWKWHVFVTSDWSAIKLNRSLLYTPKFTVDELGRIRSSRSAAEFL